MASFGYKPTTSMRDPSEQTNPMDEWARSDKRKGWVNGTNPAHLSQIEMITRAVQAGQISPEGAANLSKRVRGLAPYINSALASRESDVTTQKDVQGIVGKYITEGSPEVPARPEKPFQTTEEQAFGMPSLRGNVEQYAQEGRAAVPARADYQGAVNALASNPNYLPYAKEYREIGGLNKNGSLGELTIPKALGGSHGIKDMSDVARLSETEEGRKKLKQFVSDYQAYVPVTSYDEHGNVVTTYNPKLGAKGGSADSTLNKRVSDLWGLVEKSRITAVAPAFKVLDKKMDEYDTTGKIEGIGNLKNIKASDWVKTPEGKYMSSVIQLLENEELRQASGLAVTEPEAERKERADALKAANTAADYAKIYKTMIRPRWNNLVSGLKASSGNDALDVLKKRGFDIDKLMAQETTKPANKDDRKAKEDAAIRALRGGR